MQNVEEEIKIKVGDLVVYTEPYRYLNHNQAPPYGLVIRVEGFHAMVVWSDGETYLESSVDLKVKSN